MSEYENKKRYLQQYRDLYSRVVGLTNEMHNWDDLALRINQRYDAAGGAGSNQSSRIETGAISANDVRKDIALELSEAKRIRSEVAQTIRSVKKDYHRQVLELHYINGLPLWRVAKILRKSEETIKGVHKTAIMNLGIPGIKKEQL